MSSAEDALLAKREGERAMLREFAAMSLDDPRRAALRERIVTSHLALVVAMSQRFRDRGEPLDDIIQVGNEGLIKAVDRFDPDRGVEFSTFATPTIIGEIKRHFRDRLWAVRVPRRLQEMRMQVNRATEELTSTIGRSPTVREIAEHTGLSEDDVLDTLESSQAYATLSLDGGDDDESMSIGNTIGEEDASLEYVEVRETVMPLLNSLPARERRIVVMRFFENKTQSEIATELGISQMHVSRLLARSLDQMRTTMES